jgi:hypothetical protein
MKKIIIILKIISKKNCNIYATKSAAFLENKI